MSGLTLAPTSALLLVQAARKTIWAQAGWKANVEGMVAEIHEIFLCPLRSGGHKGFNHIILRAEGYYSESCFYAGLAEDFRGGDST